MSDAERNDPVVLSRRALIGAASAAPLYGVGNGPIPPDNLAARCREWLALDAEIDNLSRRWARLEARMVREFNWFSLSPEERRSIGQAQEMFEVEVRLDQLSDERERGLISLAELEPTDLYGIASKLAVAARALLHEDGPAYRMVADAANNLANRSCTCCGAHFGASTRHL